MKPILVCLLATAAMLCAGGPLAAQRPAAMTRDADVPLEIVAYQADLVVLAKVTRTDGPTEMRLRIPGDFSPSRGSFEKYTLAVQEVLKRRAVTEAPGPRRGENLTARGTATSAAFTADPQEQVIAYGRSLEQGPRRSVTKLQNGKTYLLVLYKIPMVNGYYLPANDLNRFADSKGDVEAMRRAADVDRWPWGQAADGLQIALLPGPAVTIPNKGPTYVRGAIALRNASDKDLVLSLQPQDKPLGLTATNGDGKSVADGFYARPRKLLPGARPFVTLHKGEVIFVGPSGQSDYGLSVPLELTPGPWTLQARFRGERDKGDKDQPLWKGQALSRPMAVKAAAFATSKPVR